MIIIIFYKEVLNKYLVKCTEMNCNIIGQH